MYADKEEVETKRSIKDRLNGNTTLHSSRRRPLTGKRHRDDDKWEHDLFQHDGPQVSNRRVGSDDLRLKLQRKSSQHGTQTVKGSVSGGVRDLREKLSGIIAQPMDVEPPRRKQKIVTEVIRPSRKNIVAEAPVSEAKRVASSVSKRNTQQKGETVDSFLESLGLEKYSITFQAEEVDMTALIHMTDEDLKAMGVPMGPRKKIILALEPKV
ncbi:RNA metabolism protein [Lithospermum erythrorhizon]|uniref:RNA metabolism protein n=1 Tax=Lithospermum erythrorhizon TaxID=34254 RepID=A0AAV3QQ66_LITER